MFRLLEAIFRLNVKEYIQYNAIKLTSSPLYKVLNYWKDTTEIEYEFDKTCKYTEL